MDFGEDYLYSSAVPVLRTCALTCLARQGSGIRAVGVDEDVDLLDLALVADVFSNPTNCCGGGAGYMKGLRHLWKLLPFLPIQS